MTDTATKAKTPYHHGDLRSALIEATRQLIEDKGIDHFSVSDACRQAGVSTAAPYKHFKNKDEMVQAAIYDSMLRHRQQMLSALAPHPKATVERMRALGRVYIEFALSEPGMFRLRFAQYDARHSADVQETGHDIYGMVLQEVADVLGEPGITEKVRTRAFMLWSLVHGMSLLQMNPELAEKSGPQDIDAILELVGDRLLQDNSPS